MTYDYVIKNLLGGNAKKFEYLQKARYYNYCFRLEMYKKGYTNKAYDLAYTTIQLYKYYFEILKGRCKNDFEYYEDLYEYYYEELIFTPTLEGKEDMKYWL